MNLSIFLLAYATGPLILSPLSELYGRKWVCRRLGFNHLTRKLIFIRGRGSGHDQVLHLSNLFFLAFNLGCAFAPNVGALIAFRFLAGLGGSAPIAIGAGVVGDIFAERERGSSINYDRGDSLLTICSS